MPDEKNNKPKGFSKALGQHIYRDFIWASPYDTGNLASSIRVISLTPKKMQFKIPYRDAPYAKRLEMGYGGHGGWITGKFLNKAIERINSYLNTDKSVRTMEKLSFSQEFFRLTQSKGTGAVGELGDRYLVGRSRHVSNRTRSSKRGEAHAHFGRRFR